MPPPPAPSHEGFIIAAWIDPAAGLAEGITPTQVNSEEFIQAIRTRLEAKLA